jgi:hypothetical protein
MPGSAFKIEGLERVAPDIEACSIRRAADRERFGKISHLQAPPRRVLLGCGSGSEYFGF